MVEIWLKYGWNMIEIWLIKSYMAIDVFNYLIYNYKAIRSPYRPAEAWYQSAAFNYFI